MIGLFRNCFGGDEPVRENALEEGIEHPDDSSIVSRLLLADSDFSGQRPIDDARLREVCARALVQEVAGVNQSLVKQPVFSERKSDPIPIPRGHHKKNSRDSLEFPHFGSESLEERTKKIYNTIVNGLIPLRHELERQKNASERPSFIVGQMLSSSDSKCSLAELQRMQIRDAANKALLMRAIETFHKPQDLIVEPPLDLNSTATDKAYVFDDGQLFNMDDI